MSCNLKGHNLRLITKIVCLAYYNKKGGGGTAYVWENFGLSISKGIKAIILFGRVPPTWKGINCFFELYLEDMPINQSAMKISFLNMVHLNICKI